MAKCSKCKETNHELIEIVNQINNKSIKLCNDCEAALLSKED